MDALKFRETFKMAILSEARKGTCRDLTGAHLSENMVKRKSRPQTQGSENCSGKKICRGLPREGSSPSPATIFSFLTIKIPLTILYYLILNEVIK